jgi:hypothetical protein
VNWSAAVLHDGFEDHKGVEGRVGIGREHLLLDLLNCVLGAGGGEVNLRSI